ncbi:hypothetical protein CDCA_CDCA01G0327 [Cyanidium caldarium]|uniref:MARVEL domain-containing protein n=1 Tax=Cyanidium caldarium TaxID=2771 RepID=A0AAV9IPV7_CYACA|nr:hypothetical protein CDCA_CDCA01G0327 [Cyanidium caldarium]
MVAVDCYGVVKGVAYFCVLTFSVTVFGVIEADLMNRAQNTCAYFHTMSTCEWAEAVAVISWVVVLFLMVLYALDFFERLPDFLGGVSLGWTDVASLVLLTLLWFIVAVVLSAEGVGLNGCSVAPQPSDCDKARAVIGLSWTNFGLLVIASTLAMLAFRQKK